MTVIAGLPAIIDVAAYRGDTWQQTFRFSDGTTPIDLTGATVACWAKNGAVPIPLQVTTGPDPGLVTIALPEDFTAGNYRYDIEVTNPDSTVTTWVRGRLDVTQDITNAT